MKYYVIYVSNGALQTDKITEWSDLDKAKGKYHDICKALWNEPSVTKANVKILDEQLDIVPGYEETIVHEPAQQS